MSESEVVVEEEQEEVVVEDVRPIAGIGTLVFGKWDASAITCKDPGLAPYIPNCERHEENNCWSPAHWWSAR